MNTTLKQQIQDARNYLQSLHYSAYYSNTSLITLSHMIKNAESKLVQLEANII